jgi:hypothetical protein
VTELSVPALDRVPWPSLGGQVVDMIEAGLVFGPGDLIGRKAVVDEEQRFLIWRMYEVHPKGSPRAGKRRFQRCAISLRKGLRKTELAAWIAGVELHPEGPVRCDGFRKVNGIWQPVGRPVTDPYIPLVAYTEEQSEDLVYGALKAMLENGPWANDFDISLERIMRLDGKGKAEPLANAPSARDGARTTFESFDETHRMILERQRQAHRTMLGNLLKRPIADPWALETTTMYAPGEQSVAEGTHDYAKKVDAGLIPNPRLFFFHRQAAAKADISTREGLTAAVVEASGPAGIQMESDVQGIVAQWDDPDADAAFLDRTWLNRPTRSSAKAFDAEAWKDHADTGHEVPPGAPITIGFDGSKYWDATAAIACEIATGYEWPLGIWYPTNGEIDEELVDVAIDGAFRDFKVWRLYGDPSKWETRLSGWAGKYGEKVVLKWDMAQRRKTAQAYRAFASAILDGSLTHADDPDFAAHIGAAHKRFIPERDDDGAPMWVAQKERPDSEHKIDAGCGGMLAWRARLDAITAGAGRPRPSVYDTRGFVVLESHLTCPDCGRETVVARSDKPGWRCPTIQGGCGQVFDEDDEKLHDQLHDDEKQLMEVAANR